MAGTTTGGIAPGSIAPDDPRGGPDRPPVREIPFGSDCFAVNLQIRPPGGTLGDLVELRERMRAETGLEMHFAPPETLHLTVFSIVYVRALYPEPPEAVWARVEAPVGAALATFAGATPPFDLLFTRAGLRGDAVIVEGDPDPRLEALRDAVEAALTGRVPVFRTATTHSTVARLAAPAAAQSRPLAAWLGREAIAWPVGALRLVAERRYPALAEELLGTFPLSGR